jgi:hypothetical protein
MPGSVASGTDCISQPQTALGGDQKEAPSSCQLPESLKVVSLVFGNLAGALKCQTADLSSHSLYSNYCIQIYFTLHFKQ